MGLGPELGLVGAGACTSDQRSMGVGRQEGGGEEGRSRGKRSRACWGLHAWLCQRFTHGPLVTMPSSLTGPQGADKDGNGKLDIKEFLVRGGGPLV